MKKSRFMTHALSTILIAPSILAVSPIMATADTITQYSSSTDKIRQSSLTSVPTYSMSYEEFEQLQSGQFDWDKLLTGAVGDLGQDISVANGDIEVTGQPNMADGTTYNVTFTYGDKTTTTAVTVAKQPATAHVHYLYIDADGNEIELAPTDTIDGLHHMDVHHFEAKSIPGYTVQGSGSEDRTVYGDNDNDVMFYYDASEGAPITVKYVDADGNEIAKSDTVTGNTNDAYTTTAKSITGYTLNTTPDNATGVISASDPQTVTYVYDKAQGADVTVSYVDADGKNVAPDDILTGAFGDKFTSNAKQIEGYTLKTTPDNATGSFTMDKQHVTYVYTKDVAQQASNVVVSYVDEDGNKIADDATLTGDLNTKFKSEAKQIDGYTLKTTPDNATGNFTTDEQAVIYVYTKNETTTNGDGTGTTGGTTNPGSDTSNTSGTSTPTNPGSDTGGTTSPTVIGDNTSTPAGNSTIAGDVTTGDSQAVLDGNIKTNTVTTPTVTDATTSSTETANAVPTKTLTESEGDLPATGVNRDANVGLLGLFGAFLVGLVPVLRKLIK